jgi:L-ascorbate metabolism protein UlaG (beta-lactamase superfamily)
MIMKEERTHPEVRSVGQSANTSSHVRIRMYNIGFGDCFLLSFKYKERDGGDKHVLIDFGTSSRPKNTPKDWIKQIANDIKTECNGHLDAVIVTHRHQDHLSGFAPSRQGNGPGDIIASLNPDLVVQPWTEHPEAEPDAKAPPWTRERTQNHIQGLLESQDFAKQLTTALPYLIEAATDNKELLEEIKFLGQENISNKGAVKNLLRMGRRNRGVYVNCGSDSGLKKILPGVEVSVLGPPTLEQSDKIRKQRTKDSSEYWHLQNLMFQYLTKFVKKKEELPPLFPKAKKRPISKAPLDTHWFMKQMNLVSLEQLQAIVRILDKVMNNTSIILLFKVGGKRLLFSGDAQIENWEYALAQPELYKELADVNVYKVGHHGSFNGTPKTLWNLFEKKDSENKKDRLTCLLSTKEGKHGSVSKGTEVPRSILVNELKKNTNLRSTQRFAPDKLYHDLDF